MDTPTIILAFVIAAVILILVLAGARRLEEKTERWERYERFIHPPEDDDGVSMLDDIEKEE